MLNYKINFLDTALKADALKFGEFTLKSGRKSPYFFNAGSFNTGHLIREAGNAYAATIYNEHIDCDTIFGPAYKGIPLATATVHSLVDYNMPHITYSSNRKETKDHGDGGDVLGAKPGQRTLIVDDVITSGKSIKESIDFIKNNGGEVCGAIILVNRQEKGMTSDLSAIQEVEQDFGIKVYSAVTLEDILAYTQNNPKLKEYGPKIEEYRAQYGVK